VFVDTLEKSLVKPRDCYDIYNSGERSDGVYTVYIGSTQRAVQVYCESVTWQLMVEDGRFVAKYFNVQT